jgi:hypothetical protein
VKLKDYILPKDGMDDVLDAAELQKYNLKNFDLSQLEPDPIFTSAPAAVVATVNEAALAAPDPIPVPVVATPGVTSTVRVEPARAIAPPPPSALEQELGLNVAAQESPWSDGFALGGHPGSEHDDLSHFAMNLGDIPACVELPVTGLGYNPFSPPQQSSSLPRWILVSMGGFFVSAAALAITFCVVLLRPSAGAAAQAPVPAAAAVVAAPAFVEQASACTDKAPAAAPRAIPAPDVRAPVAAIPKQVVPVIAQRAVVSPQAKFIRRQAHRARRTTSAAADQTDAPKSRPPQDDLDRLLGGAS